jgi:hypothetical protein
MDGAPVGLLVDLFDKIDNAAVVTIATAVSNDFFIGYCWNLVLNNWMMLNSPINKYHSPKI